MLLSGGEEQLQAGTEAQAAHKSPQIPTAAVVVRIQKQKTGLERARATLFHFLEEQGPS